MNKHPLDLKGRVVDFEIRGMGKGRKFAYHGLRRGKVTKVRYGPRMGFKGVRVVLPGYRSDKGPGFYPEGIWVDIAATDLVSVKWRGKMVPLMEWLSTPSPR